MNLEEYIRCTAETIVANYSDQNPDLMRNDGGYMRLKELENEIVISLTKRSGHIADFYLQESNKPGKEK